MTMWRPSGPEVRRVLGREAGVFFCEALRAGADLAVVAADVAPDAAASAWAVGLAARGFRAADGLPATGADLRGVFLAGAGSEGVLEFSGSVRFLAIQSINTNTRAKTPVYHGAFAGRARARDYRYPRWIAAASSGSVATESTAGITGRVARRAS
jgi:hypothetical protein